MSTSARSLGYGREKGKSSEEECGSECGHWREVAERLGNCIGVFLPKEEKGMAGLLGVKHPQQNIREFSLCQDLVKATSNDGATDGAMPCKSYEF